MEIGRKGVILIGGENNHRELMRLILLHKLENKIEIVNIQNENNKSEFKDFVSNKIFAPINEKVLKLKSELKNNTEEKEYGCRGVTNNRKIKKKKKSKNGKKKK